MTSPSARKTSATALSEQGDLSVALAAFRASLDIRQRLAAADPGNATWQRDLSISHGNIGIVLSERGNLSAALEAFLRQPRHQPAPGRGRPRKRQLATRRLGLLLEDRQLDGIRKRTAGRRVVAPRVRHPVGFVTQGYLYFAFGPGIPRGPPEYLRTMKMDTNDVPLERALRRRVPQSGACWSAAANRLCPRSKRTHQAERAGSADREKPQVKRDSRNAVAGRIPGE